MAEFREWQKGDELARLFGINEELQFGMLLQEGLDGETFVAKWRKPDESTELDSNYNPNNEALVISLITVLLANALIVYDLYSLVGSTEPIQKEKK